MVNVYRNLKDTETILNEIEKTEQCFNQVYST